MDLLRLEPVTEEGLILNGHNFEQEDSRLEERMSKAFSKKVAYGIKRNADWRCEVSGREMGDGWKCDAAHRYTHDKRDPRYNDPKNGICLSILEHLKQHIGIYFDALENGSQEYIDWAKASLRLISKRAYSQGLRTLGHYQEVPLDITDDRDAVIETLYEHGVKTPENWIF